jgi:hypothetical protein
MDLWLRKDTGRESGGTDDTPLCTQRKETTWLHEEPGKSNNGGLLFKDRRFGKAEEKSGHQKKLLEILT